MKALNFSSVLFYLWTRLRWFIDRVMFQKGYLGDGIEPTVLNLGMTISNRNAETSDIPFLYDAEKFWAEEPGHLVSQPNELKVESFERKIQELNKVSKGLYIVAINDKKIAGHASFDPMGLLSLFHIVRLTIVVHPGLAILAFS